MKLAIMQPYFMPYIGYFQLINAVDKFIIYDDVDFITRGYINRNSILINGKRNLFTLPVKDKSQNRSIRKHFYGFDKKWIRKFLKKLEMAYSKSPYFDKVYHLIQNVFDFENCNISEFNTNSLKLVCRYLNIKTEIIDTSSVYQNSDFNGQFRILDISKKENTDIYINPIGGKSIYEQELFEKEDVLLRFIRTENIRYKQFSDDFVPFLSIIDVIMFNSKKDIKKMLNKYILEK